MPWHRVRLGLIGVAILGSLASAPAARAQQRFKIGGGGGFAAVGHPQLDLGRSGNLGSFFGIRFNDNLSIEAGFAFSRATEQFAEDLEPIRERGQIPDFEERATRYHLDASLVYNLGRRQPFHPFLLGGAGAVRRVDRRTDLVFDEETNVLQRGETTSGRDQEMLIHFGAGFDLYVLHNTAARFEVRWWAPPDELERRSRRFFFAAVYFF